MTPRERAGRLIERFYFSLPNNGGFTGLCNINQRWEEGKKCALIAVDLIIENLGYDPSTGHKADESYWLNVKKEIEIYDSSRMVI